jgi:predicted DNA-binding ribbon-helix-helix protein
MTQGLDNHCQSGAGGQAMKSSICKRSIVIDGYKTSVSLEDAFWLALREIARKRNETLSSLVGSIDAARQHGNLSSAIRLFVLGVYRNSPDPQSAAQASIAA